MRKHKWNDETKLQYLKDCEVLSQEEISKLYKITMRSVISYKATFKKDLSLDEYGVKWTDANKLQYLKDCDILSQEELAKLYKININSIAGCKSTFKKYFGNVPIQYHDWSNDFKIQLINIYEEYGIDRAMQKFSLSKNTAFRYYYKFKKELEV